MTASFASLLDRTPTMSGDEIAASLVSSLDADGNELAGIRLPDVAVPVGTLVRASGGATVNQAGEDPEYGLFVLLEAFADAVEGRRPYPVPQEQMIANIAALEAIIESARTGGKVMVK